MDARLRVLRNKEAARLMVSMAKNRGLFNRSHVTRSDPQEIVHAVYPTYPGDRNLAYADLLTAKWVSDDCIRVVLKTRRDLLDSWFNVTVEPLLICRHKDWRRACPSCVNTVKNGIDKWLDKMAIEQEQKVGEIQNEPRYRLGREPGRL